MSEPSRIEPVPEGSPAANQPSACMSAHAKDPYNFDNLQQRKYTQYFRKLCLLRPREVRTTERTWEGKHI